MDYKLIIININDVTDEEINNTYIMLDDFQKNKADNMTEKRKKHFLLGRYILLKQNIDVSKIYYGTNNKPLIKGLCFSISHSFDYTAVAISHKPIGIDIEKIRTIDDRIIKYFIKNKYEIDNDIDQNKIFLQEFTKREAYIKLNGLAMKNINDSINCKYEFMEKNGYYITVSQFY